MSGLELEHILSNCSRCKQKLPEDAKFCPQCGKSVAKIQKPKARGNGQGTVYKRGQTYTAKVTTGWAWDMADPEKPKRVRQTRTKGGFATVKEARAHISTLVQQKEKSDIVTLESLWNVYSENAMSNLSKDKQIAYNIAHKKLSDIVRLDITTLAIGQLQEIVTEKAKTYYPARDMKVLLSHLYGMAVAQETVRTNLSKYIVLPKLDEKEQVPFSVEEQVAMWRDYSSGNWWTGYILLMIETGMMPGELLKATKAMVDLENHVIIGAGLKTKKRKSVPLVLSTSIEPVVANIMAMVDGDKLIRINKDNFYVRYYETLERCGCRKLTPYSCRHTTATALTLQNVPLSVVKEVMRHSRTTTTEGYVHIDTAPVREALEQIKKSREEV